MKLGFLGVGALSTPMIRNLLAANHDVTVWNRTPSKAEALAANGAKVAATAADAAAGSTVIVSCLANDAALQSVLGDGEVFRAMEDGGLHVSMSTCSPKLTIRLAELAGDNSATHLTCPVLGRPDFVERKLHRYACSGPRDAFDKIRPLLDDISQQSFYLGPNVATASIAKLCTNYLIASAVQSMGEALALAAAADADVEAIREMWNETLFPGVIYTNYSRQMLDEQFDPLFALRLMLKDVGLFTAAAADSGVDGFYAKALQERFSQAVEKGLGDEDFTAISKLSRAAASDAP